MKKSMRTLIIATMAIVAMMITGCGSAQASPATTSEATTSEATTSEATTSEATTSEATISEATTNEATISEATTSEATTSEATTVITEEADGRHSVTNGRYVVRWEKKYFVVAEIGDAGETILFRHAMSEELIKILDCQMTDNPEKFLAECINKYGQ